MEKQWKDMDAIERCAAIAQAHKQTIGTGSAIAVALSKTFGTKISRNSVISFYRRHHDKLASVPLTGRHGAEVAEVRSEPAQPRSQPKRPSARLALSGMAFAAPKVTPAPRSVIIVQPVPSTPAPEPRNLQLYELDSRQCRWPMQGERDKMLFCANATHDGTSYCQFHKAASVGIGSKAERAAVPRRLIA